MRRVRPPRGPLRLVGRASALRLAQRTLREGARLLTLVGPPGVGKTTVLAALAGLGSFVRCDLASVAGAPGLASAVAQALRLDGAALAEPAALADVLRERGRLVLALDHVETLAPTAVRTLADWLDRAPDLQVVCASRVALGLAVEERQSLPPLGPAHAARLFRDRARRVRRLVEGDRPVRAVVSMLDGLPLAIELAAARVAVLSLGDLEVRLHDRFALLRSAGPVPAGQHESLWGALTVSWDLLSPALAEMLRAIAVFRGGFDLAAAEAVLGPVDADPPVLDRLHALREHSLIVVAPVRGGLRFDLLDSVRDYAAARTDAGERARYADRHALHHVSLAEERIGRLTGRERARVLEDLGRERKNLLAALERARARDPELAARAALALYESVAREGPVSFCRELVADALAGAERAGDRRLAARANGAVGSCSFVLGGDATLAVQAWERAIALADPDEDAALLSEWERALASVRYRSLETTAARAGLSRAIEHAERSGALRLTADALGLLAVMASESGDPAEARALADRAVLLAEGSEDPETLAVALLRHGDVDANVGDVEAATRGYRRARAAARRGRSVVYEAFLEDRLGIVALLEDEIAGAERHSQRALALCGSVVHAGVRESLATGSALVAIAQGRLEEGLRMLDATLAPLHRSGQRRNEIFYGACLAAVEAAVGRVVTARERADRAAHALGGADPLLGAAVRAVRAFVSLAEAGLAGARGRSDDAERRVTASLEWWSERTALLQAGLAPRLAGRVLEWLAPRVVVSGPWAAPGAARPVPRGPCLEVERARQAREWPAALWVARDGSGFRVPGAKAVDLSSKGVLRRTLRRLLEARLASAPTVPLGPGVIAPGAGDAGARARATIRRLRQIGLGDIVREHRGGYALDPGIAVVRIANWS